MSSDSPDKNKKIEDLLAALDQGDDGAMAALIDAIYPELKRLAHFERIGERSDHTLNTTAIVHEAYLRLVGQNQSWNNRGHFLRAAAAVMRHLLVDHARKRNAAKRGDGKSALELDESQHGSDDEMMAVLALDRAMKKVAARNSRFEKIIECRYFAGLDVPDTAEALGVASRTVERDWRLARGYLLRALEDEKS